MASSKDFEKIWESYQEVVKTKDISIVDYCLIRVRLLEEKTIQNLKICANIFKVMADEKYSNRVFDKAHLLEVTIDEDDIMSFLVKMDIGDDNKLRYPANELARLVLSVLPEYVFQWHEGISLEDAMSKVSEAAKRLYETDPYKVMRAYYINNIRDEETVDKVKKLQENNRGEFGELLLHLLLRDFKGTMPLMSKVYFSDARGVPAHGFDAVHYIPETKQLWLGESKLYGNGKSGLKSLIGDLREHLTRDYMHEQFVIIQKNLRTQSNTDKEEWIKRFQKNERLVDMIEGLNLAMLCLYPHDIYQKLLEKTLSESEKLEYHKTNIRELKSFFDDHNDCPVKDRVNIVLLLFPVKDKDEFVSSLHQKLWLAQQL